MKFMNHSEIYIRQNIFESLGNIWSSYNVAYLYPLLIESIGKTPIPHPLILTKTKAKSGLIT